MKVFERGSGMNILEISYYPGMVEIIINNGWHDSSNTFNISLTEWRAMNKAVEAQHNGDNHDKIR